MRVTERQRHPPGSPTVTADTKACKTCGGSGSIWGGNHLTSHNMPCPTCNNPLMQEPITGIKPQADTPAPCPVCGLDGIRYDGKKVMHHGGAPLCPLNGFYAATIKCWNTVCESLAIGLAVQQAAPDTTKDNAGQRVKDGAAAQIVEAMDFPASLHYNDCSDFSGWLVESEDGRRIIGSGETLSAAVDAAKGEAGGT